MNAFDKVRDAVDIFDVGSFYGLDWARTRRTQQIKCPDPQHRDTSPSARVYVRSEEDPSIYCFTCQSAFDAISLTAALEEVSRGHALRILADRYGISLEPTAEEAEVRRLLDEWEARDLPAEPAPRTPETVRAAAMMRRAVGLPWEAAAALLERYEELDLTYVSPEEWLRATPPNPL